MTSLRFTLEGPREAEDTVTARDFSDFLGALLKCLRQLERETRVQAPVDYRIVDLDIGSAVVEVEAVSPGDIGKSATDVTRQFEVGFQSLERGEIRHAPFDRRTKSAFLSLMKPLKRDTRSIQFQGVESHRLARPATAQELRPKKLDAVVRGSVSGNVDALNVHRSPVFYIYPTSGPSRIRCRFDTSLLDDLRSAIKRHTTVHGLLEYEVGNPFPIRVVVERVEVNPPDEELPTLKSLYGAMPNLAGGEESAAFIARIRDAQDAQT